MFLPPELPAEKPVSSSEANEFGTGALSGAAGSATLGLSAENQPVSSSEVSEFETGTPCEAAGSFHFGFAFENS